MPTKPKHVDEELKKFSKTKLPHFFKYAKDKEEVQVDKINNSTVNKLYRIIPNTPIQFKKVAGDYDFRMLMNNNRCIKKTEIIETYDEINKFKKFMLNAEEYNDIGFLTKLKDALALISKNDSYVCDVLVSYLYEKGSKDKTTLWKLYGDLIYENLKNNLGNTICCEKCKKRVEKIGKTMVYCKECSDVIKKEKAKERFKKYRSK